MENGTPLWLDLKKEYIDDNFEKLLTYLKEGGQKNDAFYDKTLELLRDRALYLIDNIAKRTLPQDEEAITERPFNVRLLAAWLLADKEGKYAHKTFVAMLGELRMLVPKFSEELLQTAMHALFHEKIQDPGIQWSDIIRFSTEIFAYKVINNSKFIVPRLKERWWNNYGAACLSKNSLYLLPTQEEKALKTLEEMSSCIDSGFGIRVLPFGKEKLKQSQQSDILAIDNFTRAFISEMQKNGTRKKLAKKLPSYSEGDEVTVRITSKVGETIYVETTDPAFNHLQGPIVFGKKSLLYYYTSMFAKNLELGDVFPAQVLNASKQTFTIDKTFVDFISDDCKQNCMDCEFLALLIDTSQHEYVWLTIEGIPVYTNKDVDYAKGDFAIIDIRKCGTGKYLGKINGNILEHTEERFIENDVRHDCIRAFLYDPEDTADKKAKKEPVIGMDPEILQLLIRQLFAHQKHLMKPLERTRLLSVARIMAEMQHDDKAAEYIDFASDYLRALVLFARDEDVYQVSLKIPEDYASSKDALLRLGIVQLLQQWGQNGNDDILNNAKRDFAESMPVLSRIAQIIQTANSMREIVTGASLNVLKREIIKALQIETEDESDLESENGIYLGVESGSVEFKQSIVFPPDNDGQPNEEKQLRNVLRGVCAFLNSETGGTLYLGVSDQGYVKGIQRDLDALNITSPDTFMRLHIQDPAKKLLGLDAIACMHLELLYDDQVIAIHVDPSPYRIVELDGKAYLRINAESREMNDYTRQQMLSRKVFSNKEKAANLSMLQQALQNQRQVILHNYASSNSGTFSDRIVEAYDVHPDSNLVICLDHKDNKCKVFNLNRIGYVEILEKPWISKAIHKPIHVDVFHMTGENNIHCILEVDLMARNLLIEEFPKSKEYLTKYNDADLWKFDTIVHNVAGIGRFVAGLANHIRILDAPELSDYLRNYAKMYLDNI